MTANYTTVVAIDAESPLLHRNGAILSLCQRSSSAVDAFDVRLWKLSQPELLSLDSVQSSIDRITTRSDRAQSIDSSRRTPSASWLV